eukprot:3909451-Rhodomonas_salina.1
MPMGIPVTRTVKGRAAFPNLTCSKPRAGYRLQCVSPGSDQDPFIYSIAWDLKSTRFPTNSFIQDSTWG